MLLHVQNVLDAAQLAHCRERLGGAEWADGRVTAGYQSARAKNNGQLLETDPLARELGALILDALGRSQQRSSAGALPRRIYPPLFNRYDGGQAFGLHVDNAIRYDRRRGTASEAVRTDLSATLFLSEPDRLRRRRAGHRGHLRHAQRQVAGRRPACCIRARACTR